MRGPMDGVEAAEAAADDPDAGGIDVGPRHQPVQHRRCEAMEVGAQLRLEVHLALAGTVEGAGREAARQAEVLEPIAFFLGALEAAQNDGHRRTPIWRRRNTQVARDHETFECEVETYGRATKSGAASL